MMEISNASIPYFDPNSSRSTYAISYENEINRKSIDNEWSRAAATRVGSMAPTTITQMLIEPLYDYQSPEPIHSYKVKLKITSITKGQPENYNEFPEDFIQ
jgi:hypothetical protein